MTKITIKPDYDLLIDLYKWAHVICTLKDIDGGLVHLALVPQDSLELGREILEKLKETADGE